MDAVHTDTVAGAMASAPRGHSLVRPQSHISIVCDHTAHGQRHLLFDSLIAEVLPLEQGRWEVELDKNNGLALLHNNSEKSTCWAVDRCQCHAYQDSAGRIFVYKGCQLVDALDTLRSRHKVMNVTLSRPDESGAVKVQCAVFEVDNLSGRLWVDISDLWRKLRWSFSPHSGARWFQNRKDRWLRIAGLMDLGPDAVRCSLPYDTRKRGRQADIPGNRCLVFSSIHLSLLLVQAVCGAHAPGQHAGRIGDPRGRATLSRLLSTLLAHVKPGHVFAVRLDPAAVRIGSLPAGMFPASIKVGKKSVHLEGFEDVSLPESILEEVGAAGLRDYEGITFEQLFIDLILECLNLNSKGELIVRIASQLLWQVSSCIEGRLCTAVHSASSDGSRRPLRPIPSDVSAGPPESATVWSAENKRHTARELWRYQEACRTATQNAMFVSVAGPDATKIGTDLNIQVACIADSEQGAVCIAPPQAQIRICRAYFAPLKFGKTLMVCCPAGGGCTFES